VSRFAGAKVRQKVETAKLFPCFFALRMFFRRFFAAILTLFRRYFAAFSPLFRRYYESAG